ncbi:MAG: hypothetical protein VR71_22185 [Roseovarius sp. BRH_c41]|jgi:flagellar motility protein MotE (MotC chaperone)|nr:MAG: hypothetical protein VR71_22185 [Roseovarius sp. BRH_c41]
MISRSQRRGGGRGLRRSRGVLVILSSFLVASALIRIGDGAGQAFALVSEETRSSDTLTDADCQTPDDLKLLLVAVQKRESALEKRETTLQNRLHALNLADREISQKMIALKTAEDDLRQMISLTESAAENDVSQLTKVYESMKPKQAAALFEELDPVFAAGFLARMRPDSAADILAGLTPATANGISVILAGRNANAPHE